MLHSVVKDRIDRISEVVIDTQEAAVRIIDKTGPLANPADRDHCLQYMVAVALIFGRLTADDYEDAVASDRRIDTLRSKMSVREDRQFSVDYLDPDKRAIAGAVQVFFGDASSTQRIAIDYPVGHRSRRQQACRGPISGTPATEIGTRGSARPGAPGSQEHRSAL